MDARANTLSPSHRPPSSRLVAARTEASTPTVSRHRVARVRQRATMAVKQRALPLAGNCLPITAFDSPPGKR